MLRMVSVPVCRVCNGSHEAHAPCLASAATARITGPTTVDAESLIIEMQPARGAAVGPGSMLGHFKLLDEIGGGAMGTVYRALDTALDRPVAVKRINPEFLLGNKEAGARFLSEARLTARIRHENVVRVFALGADPSGQPFLVMELREGRTLTAALTARERLPLSRIVSTGMQVLAALADQRLALPVSLDRVRGTYIDAIAERPGYQTEAVTLVFAETGPGVVAQKDLPAPAKPPPAAMRKRTGGDGYEWRQPRAEP